MPKITGTMLSAGCAGTLYFDWITEFYGPVTKHIGLELYTEKPDDLPAEVEWVKSSVAQMDGVDDASVELLFSGQNFEHLFGDDAVDFLVECHRVIQPGGWLVIDSPQRDVTSALLWTMPEHTIEFSSAEAIELVTLAGFDVTSVRGLWLCREPGTGELLPLFPPESGDAALGEVLRRTVLGSTAPDDSFIWWLEATRADREPDVDALRALHASIFEQAWPERQNRLQHVIGTERVVDGRKVVHVDKRDAGFAMFGPYMPFMPGRYDVTFRLRRSGPAPDRVLAVVDVADGSGSILTERAVSARDLSDGSWIAVTVPFDVTELTWGGQFRVRTTAESSLDVELHVELTEHDASPAPTKATPGLDGGTD